MKNYAKLLAYVFGVAVEVANLNILHGTAQHYLTVGITVLTGLGIHQVNGPVNPAPTDPAVVINP